MKKLLSLALLVSVHASVILKLGANPTKVDTKLATIFKETDEKGQVVFRCLNLAQQGLTNLAGLGKVSGVKELTHLYVHENQLSRLSSGVPMLSNLQVLCASKNNLEKLPDQIGFLGALTALDVSHNKLKKLPNSVGCLVALHSLDVSHNQLSCIPMWINRFEKLAILNVANNPLQRVTYEVGMLPNLEYITISPDQVALLGPVVNQFKKLKRITIRGQLHKKSKHFDSRGMCDFCSTLDQILNNFTWQAKSLSYYGGRIDNFCGERKK